MNWPARQKSKGVRLGLTWFEPRSCWKKKHSNGKVAYFHHPDTPDGYKAALQEWYDLERQLLGLRKNSPLWEHHQALFTRVQGWYDAFGVPSTETKLANQVSAFLGWIESEMAAPEMSDTMPIGGFCLTGKRPEFYREFTGGGFTSLGQSLHYDLPAKWIDRLDRSPNTSDKEPQTIGYWLEKYLDRTKKRTVIVKKTSDDRHYKLVHFGNWCDKLAHVTDITSEFLERYHLDLDAVKTFEKKTKQGYFKAFRMFVRWCSHQTTCDLTAPKNLESREFSFRVAGGTGRKRQEKKKLLWTSEEFKNAVETLPAPYSCYLLLMLNCGFRHVDLSSLRKFDLHLKAGRIVIQRNKLNQEESAPVISYKLWPKTLQLLKKALSDDPVYAFRNERGGSVENSIKCWWKDHRVKYAEGKRLDFIRKTGSTIVARHDPNLDDFYLGEALGKTSKVSYSFNDGEPCQALDDAIGVLGAQFGYCDSPVKRVTLTKDVIDKLKKAGIDPDSLS